MCASNSYKCSINITLARTIDLIVKYTIGTYSKIDTWGYFEVKKRDKHLLDRTSVTRVIAQSIIGWDTQPD